MGNDKKEMRQELHNLQFMLKKEMTVLKAAQTRYKKEKEKMTVFEDTPLIS